MFFIIKTQAFSTNLFEILYNVGAQGFQYFSSLPVLHYLQMVLFIKIKSFFYEYLIQHSLKSGGTKGHLRWVKSTWCHPVWKGLGAVTAIVELYLPISELVIVGL